MEWYAVLIAGLTLLLGLFLSGAPIFIAFMIINVVGTLVYFGPAGFGMFANSLYDTTTFPTLIAVPLFILMGEFLFRSGAMDVLYNSLDKLVGKSRLRLYYLSISLDDVRGAVGGSDGCCRDARAIALSGAGRTGLRPQDFNRDYPGGGQPGADYSAEHSGDHHRQPRAGVDRQTADRGHCAGSDPVRAVSHLILSSA
jgi:hypothetical protein